MFFSSSAAMYESEQKHGFVSMMKRKKSLLSPVQDHQKDASPPQQVHEPVENALHRQERGSRHLLERGHAVDVDTAHNSPFDLQEVEQGGHNQSVGISVQDYSVEAAFRSRLCSSLLLRQNSYGS